MVINQNMSAINIIIKEDSQTFYYLKSIIDKNFKKKIGNKNKIIVFNDPEEETKRRYFLKLLSRVYAKKTNKKRKKIWQIEKATNKTIKLYLNKKNQLQNMVVLGLEFDDKKGVLNIKLDSKNRFILRGIEHLFSDYTNIFYPSTNTVMIDGIDKNFIKLLEDFVSLKEIFGNYIRFHYANDMFDKIKKFKPSNKRKKAKKAQILLDDFYKLLHCNSSDPYEKVRSNYLSLVKKYHPDNVVCDNPLILKVYTKKFQKIQTAYKTIKEYYEYISNVA